MVQLFYPQITTYRQ